MDLNANGTALPGGDVAQPAPAPQPEAQPKPNLGILNNDPDAAPITDWSKMDLQLGENAPVNAELLASFGGQAVKLGLTPAQARGAA